MYLYCVHTIENKGFGEIVIALFSMYMPKLNRSREPDLIFVSKDRLNLLKETSLDGPADLAVEIVSKESEERDRYKKFNEYEKSGVKEYWLIDPRFEEAFFLSPQRGRTLSFREVRFVRDLSFKGDSRLLAKSELALGDSISLGCAKRAWSFVIKKCNEVFLMKIGAIADTHDNVTKISQAVKFFNEQEELEVVVHAGDFVSPFAVAAMTGLKCRLVAVFGNNEGEKIGVAKRFEGLGDLYVNFGSVEADNRKIAVAHYPELADTLAKGDQFDVVVYGHTHEVDVHKEGETLVVNPGECGGWLTGKSTIATIDLETLEAEIHELT